MVGINTDSPTWKEAFLFPKQPGLGVVVQIAESHGSDSLEYFKQFQVPWDQ